MKHKRVWSDEARQAAAERMRKMVADRQAKKKSIVDGSVAVLEKPRDPEVQAVIDSMTPERRAKLEGIKARQVAVLESTKDGREALDRLHQVQGTGMTVPPQRIGSRELTMIVRTDGTMATVNGPCVCGVMKREWHRICLREKT